MRSSLNSTKVDSSKCPRVILLPSPFIMDHGSRRTSLYSDGAQNNCACMKIVLDLSLQYPRWNIPEGKITYSPVLLRHSLSHWWKHFFSDVKRYLSLLKQVMHVGANNSPLLLFSPKVECPDRLLSSPSTGCLSASGFISSSWTGGSPRMFGGLMLADTFFWDMCASVGAFNSGSVVVCETFASPDVFASGGAFNSVSVVVWECWPVLTMPWVEEYNQ